MRHRKLVALACCGAGLMLALLSGAPRELDAHDVFGAPLVLSDGCDYHCRDCSSGTEDKHDIVVHYSTNEHEAQHLENCNPGSCSSHECGVSFASASQGSGREFTVLPGAPGAEILALIASDPDHVKYNAARAALQFYCASGQVIASIPLSSEQQDVLAHANVEMP